MINQVTQEAPSLKAVTRQDVLNLIPRFEIRSLFRRSHLKRERVIGFIGQRGEGKSAGSASTAVVDHLFWGETVWSNMAISCDIDIDDTTAQKYGLRYGGIAHFASQPLEKEALLKLDDKYRGGCLVIEEINVQYSQVRRAMSNTNVDFNMVCQELRHFGTSLIFNVIDEMFIDSQLRGLTDVFVKVEDTAYSLENMKQRKAPGLDFKWVVYPMSASICGREQSYYITKKPLLPWYFHFGRFRGIYDDKYMQRKGTYSMKLKGSKKEIDAGMTTESSPEMREHMDKWHWLYQEMAKRFQGGAIEVDRYHLFDELGIQPQDEEEVDKYLVRNMRMRVKWSGGIKYYIFPERVFKDEREPVLA